jgi:tetratricopeptide (TPR) repeat protein
MNTNAMRHGKAALIALAAIGLATLACATGCSSAPERPVEIYEGRNAALGQIDLGNRAALRGEYDSARLFLAEAWRLAVAADSPGTRTRVLLAEGNAWFNEGNRDRANDCWKRALAEATASADAELTAVSRVYLARGGLAEGAPAPDMDSDARRAAALRARETVRAEMPALKGNELFAAFAYRALSLAEKELGDARAAEAAALEAASIHEKGRYLEDAAYDWFLLASIRSKAGNYPGAREALRAAIGFDRRAENPNGLAASWLALGTVEEKAGARDEAATAYRRSAEIARAAFLADTARAAEKKLAALEGGQDN